MEIIKNPNFDFLGKAKYFVLLSVLAIAAGAAWIALGHLRYGVEFSGGTQLVLSFQNPPQIDRIRDAVTRVSPGAVIQVYGEAKQNKVLVRIGQSTAATSAGTPEVAGDGGRALDLDREANAVRSALAADYGGNPVVESSSEIVGPVVGAELRRKAVLLTVLGLLFQLVYIAARFKGGAWGAGATIAAFHDVLICLGFLAFFGFEITLNVIAALLTLVGYSVNDTIVIFDRVRENLAHRRKEPLRKILNDSLNQTLTRTIISNGTTFLAVLGLFLFGGEVLRGFGFAMVVGILVGTYSTLFIAVPLVNWWYGRRGGWEPPAPGVKAGTVRAKAVA
jgi:preprotein translocase subunit SecF